MLHVVGLVCLLLLFGAFLFVAGCMALFVYLKVGEWRQDRAWEASTRRPPSDSEVRW